MYCSMRLGMHAFNDQCLAYRLSHCVESGKLFPNMIMIMMICIKEDMHRHPTGLSLTTSF